MNIKHLHDWDLSYDQARKLQALLAERVRFEKLEKNISLISGLDCAFSKDKKRICAVIIVLTFPDFKVVETDRRPGDPPILTADATRARSELGWKIAKPELEEMVSTAWRWHSEHREGYDD